MESLFSDVEATAHLASHLSSYDVEILIEYLQLPSGLFQNVQDGTSFLSCLKTWKNRHPKEIHEALDATRPDLVATASKIEWLSIAPFRVPSTPMESLLSILKRGIESNQWKIIGTKFLSLQIVSKIESKIIILAKNGLIKKDLTGLAKLMSAVKREDIEQRLSKLALSFIDMCDEEFEYTFGKELTSEGNQTTVQMWSISLRNFTLAHNFLVKQHLYYDGAVYIEYVPLTIVKEKPRPVNPEDETTYNEIAFLRKITNYEIAVYPVDFTLELHEYDPSECEIWCVLGNPGTGKSFLSHRTALRFGKGKLPQFSYSISIPCRSQDWHQMEFSRKGKSVDEEFIQEWLCLSMPIGPKWPSELAKHLVVTYGEGLLLIIDGLDEFTKEVPFQRSMLFLLLTRKILILATILLTSRPGAYTTISSSHTLHIDRYYQVLGFSPDNRDLYFSLQLTEQRKLKQLQHIMSLHDELQQLSLVPVNASLFAALVRGSDDVCAHTLTQLYSELVTYLIRRQLSRMRLTEMAKQKSLFQLDPAVLACVYSIGEVAYHGVYSHQLTISKDVPLKVEKVEKSSQFLGLAEEHIKKDQLGDITRVWSFPHLTIQEFLGAIWLSVASWRDQVLSSRYIANSNDNFSMFRMIVRFVCGLLSDNASPVLTVLYKHLPVSPVSMRPMPMCYQLKYNTELPEIMGWIEFTEQFVTLSEMLFESNSDSIFNSFADFRKFLPESLYFYFDSSSTSPNEWQCFLRSLPLLRSVQLIHIDTRYFTLSQFRALLAQLTSCSLSYLAVSLYEQGYSTITAYSDAIRESQLSSGATKFSLELSNCKFTDTESADHVPPESVFKSFSNLCLYENQFIPQCLQQVADQLISTENLYIWPHYEDSSIYETLLPRLNNATQLTGLHLYRIPTESTQLLQTLFSQLSNLQEIALRADTDTYTLLPRMRSLSSIKYLELCPYEEPTNTGHKDHLMRLLNVSTHTLRGLVLHYVHSIGPNSCEELFLSLSSCTNLVEIQLCETELQQDDVTLLGTAVSRLRSLLYLLLWRVPLTDSAMLRLCRGLLNHYNIRRLDVWRCELNSNSCDLLTQLIPTLPQFNTLSMYRNNLSGPNPDSVNILKRTADMYSVNCSDLK